MKARMSERVKIILASEEDGRSFRNLRASYEA